MKLNKTHKKEKCPCCKSKEILTMGFDQTCLDCDWNNSLMLVQMGQLDDPGLAYVEHFVTLKSFDTEDVQEKGAKPSDFKLTKQLKTA